MVDIRVTPRRGESIDQTIRRFRRRIEREGVVKEFRRHQYYEKPSERSRRDEMRSKARLRRVQAGRKPGR